jgi:PAS domain S-box-containing protein
VPTRNKISEKSNEKSWTPVELGEWFSVVHACATLPECLNAAAEKVVSFFHADGVEIHLLNERSLTLEPVARKGISAKAATGGDAIPGRVFDKGFPLFVESLQKDDGALTALIRKEGFQSYAGVPLSLNDERLGVLGLYFKAPKAFGETEKAVLNESGRHLGLAIHNINRYSQAVQKAQRLTGLSRAMAVTRQLGTLDRVLDDISKMLVSGLGFDLSWIGLVSDDGTRLEGKAGFGAGLKHSGIEQLMLMTDDPQPVLAMRDRRTVSFKQIEVLHDSPFKTWLASLDVHSGGFVPLQSGDRILGAVGCFFTTGKAFNDEDSRLLTSVSEQASIAIDNAKLYEQVKLSEERYRTLFDSTGTSKAIIDAEGQFKLVNRSFEALSGFTAPELVGKKSLFHFLSRKKTAGPPAGGKMDARPQKREEEFVDKNKDIKHVYVLTAPISGSGDSLVSIVDITRERELEKQLHDSQELASLGELSAGIAHEIRNPLIAINTSVSILKDEKVLSPEGQQVLDVVKEETDHLAAIVNDFLKYARPKKLVLEQEDINKLVRDALKRVREQQGEKVVWIEQYDETLLPMFFDHHQLQQVVVNLISNSLDAMQGGGKLFVETAMNGDSKDSRVLIIVKDTGTGIVPDLLGKIFLPFFSTKEKGTGMGLAICHRIVNQHGGDIFVESEPGKGAVFTVSLPMKAKSIETDD